MKNATKVLALFIAALLLAACGSLTPAERYAREHRHREFQGWKHQNKKMDKDQKKKVKDSSKIPHTWK